MLRAEPANGGRESVAFSGDRQRELICSPFLPARQAVARRCGGKPHSAGHERNQRQRQQRARVHLRYQQTEIRNRERRRQQQRVEQQCLNQIVVLVV